LAPDRDAIVAEIPRLRRYARALLRDAERADDLVQDCLERAISRWHLWRPNPTREGGGIRAWLFTIMHNVYLNQARRLAAMPPVVQLEATGPLAEPARQTDRVALGELAAALSRLSDDHRHVLLLVAVEGMGYREAARILNVPEGTVMSRLSRAREQLRQSLSSEPSPVLRRVK
jgi:RNA polymerase sigma-70 factor (ECF subfamily)